MGLEDWPGLQLPILFKLVVFADRRKIVKYFKSNELSRLGLNRATANPDQQEVAGAKSEPGSTFTLIAPLIFLAS